MKALKITGMVVGGIGFFALIAAAMAWILSLLWNWLMPMLFSLPEINLWQAAGIFILSKILFTPGFGKGSEHKRSKKSRKWGESFRRKMEDRKGYSHCTEVKEDTETIE